VARSSDETPRPRAADGLEVPASIVRVRRCGADWYEVGARFLLGTGEQAGTGEMPAGLSR
jgi:hypothetical protein